MLTCFVNTRLLHSSILISCSGVCLLSQTPSLPQRSQTRGWQSQWWPASWPPFVSWRLPSSSARSLLVSSTSSIVASSNGSEVSPSKLQDQSHCCIPGLKLKCIISAPLLLHFTNLLDFTSFNIAVVEIKIWSILSCWCGIVWFVLRPSTIDYAYKEKHWISVSTSAW